MKTKLLAGAMLLAGAGAASATTFTFNDFSDLSGFTLNGTASTLGNPVNFGGQNVLRLTDNINQSGSAFLSSAVTLASNASFSSFFSFQITDPVGISDGDGQGADGIVFVVQTVANNVGGGGGGIGYEGIPNSVGIEFDTWNNGGVDDNNGNHVGVDVGGSVDSLGTVTPIANRMNNGAIWYAWVDYDGNTDLLEVRLNEGSASRPAAALISLTRDLALDLGSTSAFVGFTSGTGSAGGDHDIRGWTFVNEFAPIDGGNGNQVPEPASLGLLGIGLAGLGALRRKR